MRLRAGLPVLRRAVDEVQVGTDPRWAVRLTGLTPREVEALLARRLEIGRALATQLRTQGFQVAAVSRDVQRLSDVDADLRIAADVTTPEGAAAAVETCQGGLGAAPTLLAHCVGSTLIAPLHRTKPEAYRDLIRVNLDSAVFMLQAWLAALMVNDTARPRRTRMLVKVIAAPSPSMPERSLLWRS